MSTLVGRDFFPPGREYYEVWDEFDHYVSTDTWTTTATNSGSVAVSDEVGGVVKVYPSSGENSEADNDETYMKGTTEVWKFANNKPIIFEARVKPYFNTSTGINVFAGLMDAVAADSIDDDGAGPKTTSSHVGFILKDGDATWYCGTSVSTTQKEVDTGITATNNTWTTLRFEVSDYSSTQNQINFFIDGIECGWDVTTKPGNKIAQTVTFASATEMESLVGCKNGEADDSQWIFVDYFGCRQQR